MDELEHLVADMNWMRHISSGGFDSKLSELNTKALEYVLPEAEVREHSLFRQYSEGTPSAIRRLFAQPMGFHFFVRFLRQLVTGSDPSLGELTLNVAKCTYLVLHFGEVDAKEKLFFVAKLCRGFLLSAAGDATPSHDNLFNDLKATVETSRSSKPVVWYERKTPVLQISEEDWDDAARYLQQHDSGVDGAAKGGLEGPKPTAKSVKAVNPIGIMGPCVANVISATSDTMNTTESPSTTDNVASIVGSLRQLRIILLVKLLRHTGGTVWQLFANSPQFARFVSLGKMIVNKERVAHQNFLKFRMLGRGAQGEVFGCVHDVSRKPFAVKQIPKHRIMLPNDSSTGAASPRADSVARHRCRINRLLIQKERQALVAMANEHVGKSIKSFVLSLVYSFQTPTHVALVFDIMLGGSLQYYLKKEGCFFQGRAQFYAAEIALGLQHLHRHGIIYRDLKPHNLMLDTAGHVCITDLGLVEFVNMTQKMLPDGSVVKTVDKSQLLQLQVGTRGYWAPEVLRRSADSASGTKLDLEDQSSAQISEAVPGVPAPFGFGHYSFNVDWWSFGVVLYQMLSGINPFRNAGLLFNAGLDPKTAKQEECRSVFDQATLRGEFDAKQAMKLQARGAIRRSKSQAQTFGRTSRRRILRKASDSSPRLRTPRSSVSGVPPEYDAEGLSHSFRSFGVKPSDGDAQSGDGEQNEEIDAKSVEVQEDGPPEWLAAKYEFVPVHTFSDEAADLLESLLVRDPEQRIGSTAFPSEKALRVHPFFEGISWEKLQRRAYNPPFIPANRINADSQKRLHRDRDNADAKNKRKNGGGSSGSSSSRSVHTGSFGELDDWDYVCEDAYQREVVQGLLALESNPKDASSRARRNSDAVDVGCRCVVQ